MELRQKKEKSKVIDERRTDPDEVVLEGKKKLMPRPPIVTVMGHVDHGKTTLLDTLRNANVASGEVGGITQAVSAFTVNLDGNDIVFLDTPGHEAFTSMRKCGSILTDLIVLIVAATDGVRPQTLESIEMARAAGVPIIVALTKVDMPGIDIEMSMEAISNELNVHGVITERHGGNVQIIPVSAPTGLGLEDLTEAISLQAEERNLLADPKSRGEAVILEGRIDRNLGVVCDLVTRWGTLKVGDYIVCGEQFGRIRQLLNTVTSKPVKQAPPSTPARLLGLKEVPAPGLDILAVPNNKRAKQVVEYRIKRRVEAETQAIEREQRQLAIEEAQAAKDKNNEDEDEEETAQTEMEVVNVPIILKADTDGSLEALRYSVDAVGAELEELTKSGRIAEGSGFKVIRRGVGEVTQSDVELAKSFGGQIFAFNVRSPAAVMKLAAQHEVNINSQSVIYHLLDDLRSEVDKATPKEKVVEVVGRAFVKQVFKMNPRNRREGEWVVAGCEVRSGTISKNKRLRVVRNEEVIHHSGLDSLRSYKDEVSEIKSGQDCGIALSSFQDFEVGDIIEAYDEKEG
mmetsp:Transcript_1279/g.1577  ORF Transcript_1279/g.1577 Transcript_1279/m.1577 type:complete len:571 (-) Transcript_1279:798-2510(-)